MKKTLIVGCVLAIIVGIGFFAGWQYFIHNQTKQEIFNKVEEISCLESLEYENLKVGFWIVSTQKYSTESDSPATLEMISVNVNQMLQKEKNEKTRTVLEHFLKFLNNPKKLHITLLPEKPVPLGRFLWVRNLNDLVQLLNMSIEI